MSRVLRGLVFLFVWTSWRIYRFADIVKFHVSQARHGKDGVKRTVPGVRDKKFKNAAVVVAAYPDVFEESTLRLIKGLAANDFDVYLVWNGHLSESTLRLALPECVEVIHRLGRGFDWAGYKYVFNKLEADADYNDAGLFLSNDSFFYFQEIENLITKMIAMPWDVKGMVLNKEIYPHIVGANVYLSAVARKNSSVLEFWRKYKPSWDKRTTIFKGEIEHFRAIKRGGLRLSVLTTELSTEDRGLSKIAEEYSARLNRQIQIGYGNSAQIRLLGKVFETRSILHVLGPYLSKHWGFPMKLDLLKWRSNKWSTLEIENILKDSGFVTRQDLLTIVQHFGAKNSYASTGGLLENFYTSYGFFK